MVRGAFLRKRRPRKRWICRAHKGLNRVSITSHTRENINLDLKERKRNRPRRSGQDRLCVPAWGDGGAAKTSESSGRSRSEGRISVRHTVGEGREFDLRVF